MPEITVKLPDGSPLELADGATGADAAAAIGPRLAKDALGIKVDGELRDLGAELPDGAEIAIVTARSKGADAEDALWLMRHDAAHVMATAVVELWPGTKVSIGPPIDDGFYYDFEFPDGERPSEADLERIEAAMREHIAADEPFERTDVPVAEAIERFRAEDQPYKVELIEDLVRDEGVETVSLYRNGPFTDLCRGPHAPSTGRIKAFKLNSLAGAYWRGDENRQMLTRIYGTAFHSQKDLDRHLELLELARENDHRRLGPELDLFRLREESPGMPFWLPNGTVLLRLIEAEVREQLAKRGYEEIKTPRVLDEELWHRSGHWDNYRENMYFVEPSQREGDERRFALKPMNCPGACLVFASERHSYRELPLRLAEFGDVSRYEREGVLHGLLRVRAFTQDDAHVYCTLDQVADEVDSICEAIDELYARFGFDDGAGRALDAAGEVDRHRRAVGARDGGAARGARAPGPRVRRQPGGGDLLRAEDRLPRHRRARPLVAARHLPARLPDARALRAQLPGRGQRRAPAGDDPPRAARLDGALRRDPDRALRRPLPGLARAGPGGGAAGLRHAPRLRAARSPASSRRPACGSRVDERSESVGRKIRDAELAKLPFMLVVGEREEADGTVSVRSHERGDLGALAVGRDPGADRLMRAGMGSRDQGRGVVGPGCVTPRSDVLVWRAEPDARRCSAPAGEPSTC